MKRLYIIVILFLLMIVTTPVLAGKKGTIGKMKRINVANAYVPKVLGLFVGIETFSDPLWHELKYPVKDVADISRFFSNNKTLSLDYKLSLTKKETTTRDYILNYALDAFGVKNSSEEDIVIVYFSGHGTLAKEQMTHIEKERKVITSVKRPYIVTSDTRADKVTDSALGLQKVIDWFDRLKSRRKVLILDMCHSGLGKSQLSPDQKREINSEKGIHFIPMEDSWASIILSACPMGGTSFEDETLGNSIYTRFLIEGMKTGDLNGDGAITISEAHSYAIDKTQSYTFEHKGYRQVPTAYSRILGKDPIVVNGRAGKEGAPVLFSYASASQGVEVFVDKKYKGMLPKGMRLDPGEHHIECKLDNQVVFSGTMTFANGYDYMLPEFIPGMKTNDSFIVLEAGYRTYQSDSLSENLIPDSVVSGISYYKKNILNEWFGAGCGFNYAQNKDVTQYALRGGIKYVFSGEKTNLFLGPDLMFLNFNYESDMIGTQKVDRQISFLCPGADLVVTHETTRKLKLSTGLRSYYMPYKLNTGVKSVITGEAFIAIRYAF